MNKKNLILPGHPRYQPKQMQPFFGYDNTYQGLARVEIATMKSLIELRIIPESDALDFTEEKKKMLLEISATEVEKLEREVTRHDVRAWVQIAQAIVGEKMARWVHVPLTSYDALDTGRILQYKDAYTMAIKPSLKKLLQVFATRVEKFAHITQIGRTHGQHALPITVGFWLASILSRVLENFKRMDDSAFSLVGKISGAVGAYNAQIALFDFCTINDPHSFERKVLQKLKLSPALVSTQIIPPEPLAYFLFSCLAMSATFAQFGRDCRHLMRSEIEEVCEGFDKNQVGSSTMAQKRNPITFENLEGMGIKNIAEFQKVLLTLISEHQRDLVGSCVARDLPIIPINLQQQLNTLLRVKDDHTFLERINIDEEACLRNLSKSAGLVIAEPIYIALQMAGFTGDAHHFVNHTLVPEAKSSRMSLIDVLETKASKDEQLQEVFSRIPNELILILKDSQKYTGAAGAIAINTAQRAFETISQI